MNKSASSVHVHLDDDNSTLVRAVQARLLDRKIKVSLDTLTNMAVHVIGDNLFNEFAPSNHQPQPQLNNQTTKQNGIKTKAR